jgi:lincosamide nucleotidyltransferase A/C/D/E
MELQKYGCRVTARTPTVSARRMTPMKQTMPADRALALWRMLSEAGADVWVDGGWGVDALQGRQTRAHGDLDLGVARTDLALVVELLGRVGFAVIDRRYEQVTVRLADGDGQRVDLHPSTPLDGGGTEQLDFDGNRYFIPPAVAGRIDGHPVRCMPLEAQLRAHSGYELRQQDLHDLALLRELARST